MGVSPWAVHLVALLAVAAAAAVDVRQYRIPNAIPAGLCLAALVLPPAASLPLRLGVGLLCGAVLVGARWAGQAALGEPGLGWGDVKLAAALGLLLGGAAAWSLYLGIVLAAAWGVAGRVTGALAPRARLPLGPFFLGGLVLGLFVLPASQLWAWLTGAAP